MQLYHQVVVEEDKVEKVICNCCKKEIRIQNGIPEEEFLSIEKKWGYFSNKDNETHCFDLCEECYDRWIRTFEIPVERK